MRTRLRFLIPAAFIIIMLVVLGVSVEVTGAAHADPVCSNGTNWDNILQVCR
jgi:hypothetical protein